MIANLKNAKVIYTPRYNILFTDNKNTVFVVVKNIVSDAYMRHMKTDLSSCNNMYQLFSLLKKRINDVDQIVNRLSPEEYNQLKDQLKEFYEDKKYLEDAQKAYKKANIYPKKEKMIQMIKDADEMQTKINKVRYDKECHRAARVFSFSLDEAGKKGNIHYSPSGVSISVPIRRVTISIDSGMWNKIMTLCNRYGIHMKHVDYTMLKSA